MLIVESIFEVPCPNCNKSLLITIRKPERIKHKTLYYLYNATYIV